MCTVWLSDPLETYKNLEQILIEDHFKEDNIDIVRFNYQSFLNEVIDVPKHGMTVNLHLRFDPKFSHPPNIGFDFIGHIGPWNARVRSGNSHQGSHVERGHLRTCFKAVDALRLG